jgi:hypothetical protein
MGHSLADVMDRENVVVNDAFHEVEEAPPDQHPADEGSAADCPVPVCCAPPEDVKARGDGDPGSGVKDSVPEGIRLEARYRRAGIVARTREHVMPLKQLVEHDPVHEAPKADTQKNSGKSRAGRCLTSRLARMHTFSGGRRSLGCATDTAALLQSSYSTCPLSSVQKLWGRPSELIRQHT